MQHEVAVRIDNLDQRMQGGHCEMYAQGVLVDDQIHLMISLQVGGEVPEILGTLKIPAENFPIVDGVLNLGAKSVHLPYHYELCVGDQFWHRSDG